MFKFELPREQSSIIKVIGVGGGGSNAVNYMYRQQIKGVDFIVCNTDSQSLEMSPVPIRIQLGSSLTQGLGAGALPEVGRNAAIENIEEIKAILGQNTKMVFITAGMGGGTGTGAAPVIAQTARDMGILTVGIVTIPFGFEGKKRKQQAEDGLENMRNSVDTLLVINNDKLREMYGNLTLANAFGQADEVLNVAARGIAEMISVTGLINVDFNDVNTVMRNSGVAIMGQATASGENRARVAVEKALSSPLLNDNHIEGAKFVLLNITYGTQEVTMDEIAEITDFIQEEAGSTADVIWGHGFDEALGDSVSVTVIATGFNRLPDTGAGLKQPEKKKITLVDDTAGMITAPITSPTQMTSTTTLETTLVEEPYLKSEEQESEIIVNSVIESPTSIDEPVLKTTYESSTPIVENTTIQEPENNSYDENENWEDQISVKVVEAEKSIEITSEKPIIEEEKTEVVRHWLLEDETEVNMESSTTISNEISTPINEEKKQVTAEVKTQKEEQPTLFPSDSIESKTLSHEDQQKRASERLARIKELSAKLKTPSGLNDLESEPAYLRRNVTLNKTQHSSESNVSKYSVNDDKENKDNNGLKSNNSFLHDNVD